MTGRLQCLGIPVTIHADDLLYNLTVSVIAASLHTPCMRCSIPTYTLHAPSEPVNTAVEATAFAGAYLHHCRMPPVAHSASFDWLCESET